MFTLCDFRGVPKREFPVSILYLEQTRFPDLTMIPILLTLAASASCKIYFKETFDSAGTCA
jgi:hypothetical protein